MWVVRVEGSWDTVVVSDSSRSADQVTLFGFLIVSVGGGGCSGGRVLLQSIVP